MMGETRFVILGIQRTGTTLLVRLLDAHPEVVCVGELFQSKSAPVDHDLPRYRGYVADSMGRRLLAPLLCRRSVHRYLDRIYGTLQVPAFGFKLMLDQVRRYPAVAAYLREKDFRIIHVVRENLLKTHVSRLRARQTGIYASTEPLPGTQVSIPTASLAGDLDALARENRALESLTAGLGLTQISVSYEAITGDRSQGLSRILSFLGVDATVELESQLVKLTPDELSRAVENYEEMAAALAGSDYEHHLC
jgi:LPS sulfotransferase NodH